MGATLVVDGLLAGYGKLRVVDGIGLVAPPGQITAIVGANGAGKTTLLRGIMGLVDSSGSIRVGDEEIGTLSSRRRVVAGLALVPEGRQLFPGLTVKENLLLGAAGAKRRKGRQDALAEVCDLFPGLEPRLRARAGVLSGGQQQMVAIGRALMADPRVLLLDEPSQGLAPVVWSSVLDALRQIAERGRTVVVVEQRTADVVALAARTEVMRHGRFVLHSDADDPTPLDQIVDAYMGRSRTR